MRKLVIAANFHVDIADPADPEKPPVRKAYGKGMVVDEGDLPDGHTAEDWLVKGLATRPPEDVADQA